MGKEQLDMMIIVVILILVIRWVCHVAFRQELDLVVVQARMRSVVPIIKVVVHPNLPVVRMELGSL